MSEGIYKKKGQANMWRNDNIMNEYCLQKEVPRNYRTCIPPLQKGEQYQQTICKAFELPRRDGKYLQQYTECSEAGHCDSRGVEKSSKTECSSGKESGGDMGSRLV